MTESTKLRLSVLAIVALFLLAGCVDYTLIKWGM